MSNILEWYEKQNDRLRLIFVIISGVALAASLTFSWTGNADKIAGFDPAWIAIVLCGVPIVLGAIVGLVKDHDITADVLVALALIGSLILNEFFAAGEVAFIMQIGSILEDFTSDLAKKGISKLIKLSPKKANLFVEGQIKIIEADQVKLGDILQVRAGESIPVDGKIIEGSTSIDQSAMTGESIPIEKNPGDLVMSGTINQNGTIECRAIRVGNSTTLNQIIQSVEKAANSKAKISKIADRASGIFVPVVILFALITFTFWMIFGKDFINSHSDINSTQLSYSIERAIAILVISCPCALGLATPVAIMVGSGKAARNGILFKNAEAIEETGKISYVIFDKTGTITKGKPVVTDIISNISEDELLVLAVSIEAKSSHPLANAITALSKERNIAPLEVDKFENVQGRGLKGYINKESILAGNKRFMAENNVNLERYLEKIDNLSKLGKTPLIFAKNGEFAGIIAVSDVVKEDSKEAISKIKALGIIPIMVTGDNSYSANYIASLVGIDYVISETLPEGKLDVINKLKQYGKVAMVGDGINDAIALTSADVGIAIAQGSDIAIDSANVVLMKSSLMDAYASIRLSQYVYLNIKENLFWAFIYNLIMIPIAAGAFSGLGLYKVAPWMGSAAMALSSVFVVLNALRINLFKPYKNKRKIKNVIIPKELTDINSCDLKENKDMEKVYKIEGMMCMHCVKHVKDAISSIRGVDNVEVSLEKGTAKVSSEKDIKDKDVIKAVTKAGYKVK